MPMPVTALTKRTGRLILKDHLFTHFDGISFVYVFGRMRASIRAGVYVCTRACVQASTQEKHPPFIHRAWICPYTKERYKPKIGSRHHTLRQIQRPNPQCNEPRCMIWLLRTLRGRRHHELHWNSTARAAFLGWARRIAVQESQGMQDLQCKRKKYLHHSLYGLMQCLWRTLSLGSRR